MAIELPVFIDIDKAFKEAAGRVKTAMKPLQSVLDSAPASLFIDVKIGKSKKVLADLFLDETTSVQKFQEALNSVEAKINKLAAKGGFSLLKGLTGEEKNLLEAATILESKIKGVGNASSTMGKVLTINMKAAEAEIAKYTAQLDKLQRKQNMAGKLTGGTDPRVDYSKYGKQIDLINAKIQQQRTFLSACAIELDRMGLGAAKVGVAVDLTNKQAIEMAASFRRGHEYLQRWNAGLATAGSHLGALIKSSVTLIGLHSAFRFIQNVRNVTAEFEMQRVALGGIIQDTEKAESLFKQIKAAAIQSPFEIKDLVSFTKQLSAYRIETEDLFDVTMRLADVSAGLGVDMSRLVLAYGQVRAAAVLRGQELRQFTEAGIPLVDLLAEKFTKLNGRTVKTAEVFDLISKRAVPFSMIKEIFEDMTNAGGIFYKMQEKQSETLKGQWMKLKDAASIMYDEIGNTDSVHNAMTDLLATSMKLMQNWREIGKVLGAAAASYVAYRVVIANARIAANALTAAEVAEISALELNTVSRSKLIAAIWGEATATKVQIALGNAYVAVKRKEMMATNLFTKALYGMLAAMLKNPYALAAAAIAALIAVIVRLAKKTDDSRISIDKFQKSVESFNKASSHADDIDKLCDKYDQLANKADRTKEETDELVRVTKELGRAYPQAINGTDAQTGALDLNTEAIRENNKEAREAIRLKMELDKQRAENSMADLVEERNKIIAQLQSGTKLQYVQTGSGMYGASGTYQEVNLSDEDRAKFGERLMELNKQIGDFQTAIDEADAALQGLTKDLIGPPLPDFFGDAWRSQLNSYTTTLKSTGTAIKALTKDQIEGFGDQMEALKAVAKEYEAQTALVDFYTKALQTATGARKVQTQQSLDDALLMQAMYKKILEDFNALDLLKTPHGTGYSQDPFIRQMENRVKFMKDFKKGYDDLNRYMNKAGALGRESDIMLSRGLSLGISASDQKRAAEELSGWYTDMMNEAFEKAKKKGASGNLTTFLSQQITGSSNKAKALRDFQALLQSLWDAKTDLDTTQKTKDFEDAFKRMKDELKQSETVKKFYDDLLSMTGDSDLATTITVSVYGGIGQDFKERMQSQLNEAFASLGDDAKTPEMKAAIDSQDFGYILDNLSQFPKEWQDVLKDMAKDSQKHYADMMMDIAKAYEKAKDYDERRTDVHNREAQRRVEIEEWYKRELERIRKEEEAGQITHEEAETQRGKAAKVKDTYTAASNQKEAKEKAAIDVEALKNTYEWTKAFEDLDRVGNKTLSDLAVKIQEIIDKEGNLLTPEQLKAMSDALEKVKNTEASRNPITAVSEGFTGARLAKQGMSAIASGDPTAIANAKKAIDEFNKSAKGTVKLDFDHLEDGFRDANKQMEKGIKGMADYVSAWGQLASGLQTVRDYMGEVFDIEDIPIVDEVLKGVTDSLSFISAILPVIITLNGILNATLMMNPFIAMAAGIIATIGAVVGLIKGIVNAKVERLNKKIEEQEDILHNLEKDYDALDKAIQKAFGSDYISTYNQQMKVMEAETAAYREQARLERKKGKKADEKKAKGYEEEAEKLEQKMAEMRSQVSEFMSDSDVTSAAKSFAKSWIDAYKQFAFTSGAIKENFKEMIDSMVVNSLAAKIIQDILKPIFKEIDDLAQEGGELSEQDIAKIAAETEVATEKIDTAMQALMQRLAAAGINMRATGSDLSGISKDIAGASEESINGLAAGINTQNFYMSYMPAISATVDAILAAIGGSTGENTAAGRAMARAASAENQTGQTFGDETFRGQMQRIDENISEMRYMLKSVITPKSANTNTHAVATK